MDRHRFGNSDLTVSAIGPGCYGMSGVYGPADDAESIATIRRSFDLGVNFLDTSASYGDGHNHRLIAEGIRGRSHDVVIHSKSGSPRDGGPEAVRGGSDPRYLRQTCEQSCHLSKEAGRLAEYLHELRGGGSQPPQRGGAGRRACLWEKPKYSCPAGKQFVSSQQAVERLVGIFVGSAEPI